MTTAALIDDLKRDEGLRLTAYRDTVGVWTVGYGHTGADVGEGDVWDEAEAQDALLDDVATAELRLDATLPWWRSLDDVRQDVLAEMAFNLGIAGLLGFHHTLEAIERGDWTNASAGMLLSKWASQVGDRAQRLAFMMRTGSRPGAKP